MEIKYEIVPTDITHYSKEAVKGTSFYTVQAIILCSITILFMMSDMILAAVAVFKNDGSITVSSFNMLPRLLISFAILGTTYFVLMTYSKHMALKVGSTPGKNGLFCEHAIALDERGFTETTHVNRNFISWEGAEKITETKNYLAINIRLGSSYFIPKRAFSDDGQLREFVSKVGTYIENANVPPPPTFA